jgi:hypothetical protein
MKHVKKYEAHNIRPKVGDYVICEELSSYYSKSDNYEKLIDFINSSVGQIKSIGVNELYVIEYFDVPSIITSYFNYDKNNNSFKIMDEDEILHFSSSREELELKLVSIKYNL